MRLKHLLAGMVVAVTVAVLARGQPAVDTTRVPQWLDSASGLVHYLSSQYPFPMRPPSTVHTTLPTIVLNTGVPQVVISAGWITNGCDISFSNTYGDYYLAYTDPTAPAVPTAAAPTASGVTPASPGRGLHLQYNSGISGAAGYVYHCPGSTAQGVSIAYVGNNAGQATTPSPTALISVDVY